MRKYWSSFTDVIFTNPAATDTVKDDHEKQQQDSHVGSNDENIDRGNWTNKREYMLSMIGYAVGLGNVWRFPYLAYKNGGGAFLIPYVIMLAVAGIPLFFLESSFGQFCSQGPVNVWRALPIFQGVGVAMVLVSTLVGIYYNVIIAYSLYYMFASFQSPLPWSDCFYWSNSNCSLTPREVCNNTLAANWSEPVIVANMTLWENETCPKENIIISIPVQSPSEQYWDLVALQRSSGLDETGPVVWHLALCLLLGWLLIAAALYKGIKSSGKVVYFTATFPYVVLLILLIRGVTLEGARDGIEFYIGSQSNLTKLGEAEVWRDATTQIFYSLSVAWGGVTALSSYNKFHNNVFKDALTVCLTNCGTSVFAGFAIFSILGHMAHVYGKPVSEVAQAGFGLAFIAYPDALSKLPISPLWSILFFFMLLTLGLDSQFAGIEVISTCLQDAFPDRFKSKRSIISVGTCAILFLLGLPCITQAGIYWVTLMDQFCAGFVLLIAALLELVGVFYFYGGNRFIKDIEMMIGTRSSLFWLWWRACWFFITPAVITVILVWSLLTFRPPSYGMVQYPAWGVALGWCMIAFCLIWIPLVAIWKILCAQGNPWQVIGEQCRCAVGSVLSEGDTRPSEELQQLYEKFGFRVFSFPEVTHVVSASFPHRTPLSIFFGVQRVYPQLESYIKERKLCAHPCLEIYRDDLIHYMSPLARQGDFYVPEVRQDPDRRLLGDNYSEEDRGTDITGADSNSECSSGSGVFLSDSRETSLAPSSVPSLIRHYRGGTGGGGGEDRSDRSSSSSSFEELDMELPDGQEEAGTEQASDAPGNKHLETTTEERGVVAGGEE